MVLAESIAFVYIRDRGVCLGFQVGWVSLDSTTYNIAAPDYNAEIPILPLGGVAFLLLYRDFAPRGVRGTSLFCRRRDRLWRLTSLSSIPHCQTRIQIVDRH